MKHWMRIRPNARCIAKSDTLFFNRRGGPRARDLQNAMGRKQVTTRSVRKAYRTEVDARTSKETQAILDSADRHAPSTVQSYYVQNKPSVYARSALSSQADKVYSKSEVPFVYNAKAPQENWEKRETRENGAAAKSLQLKRTARSRTKE